MHALFIGGTGLISTAIARQLLDAGHRVTLFNRGQSENRLPPGAAMLRGDRQEYTAFEKTFAGRTFDVVVDMVAYHPDDTASAIRAFASRAGQFLHCSTVCVYSGPVTQIAQGHRRRQPGGAAEPSVVSNLKSQITEVPAINCQPSTINA